MQKLEYVPTYAELDKEYGRREESPGVPLLSFERDKIIRVNLPYPMKLSWGPRLTVNVVSMHTDIAPVFVDAEREILAYKGLAYLQENGYDFFGGAYNYRPSRGGGSLSTHAWGIAVDRNPDLAPYYNRKIQPDETKWVHSQPDFIIKAYESRGFVNLPWDRMHFQACRR